MLYECHAHLFMDGVDYKKAVLDHKDMVNQIRVREHLQAYKGQGVGYIRDGGDRFGVSVCAREMAREYGLIYRTPVFAISRKGHYGRIVGKQAESLQEYHELVLKAKEAGADFIKIMVSGIMEYSAFGLLSEEALEERWIKEMIVTAHGEGMAVMVHGNGREAVLPAILAGADSIEHGNYIDKECMDAMAESGCVWVPTIVTTGNLIGCGRYEDSVLRQIYDMECRNLLYAYEQGVRLAPGSDAGAYRVLHGTGVVQETMIFLKELQKAGYAKADIQERLRQGEQYISETFRIDGKWGQ